MKQFFSVLDSLPSEGPVDPALVNYCERFLELMTDLEVSKSVCSDDVYVLSFTSCCHLLIHVVIYHLMLSFATWKCHLSLHV